MDTFEGLKRRTKRFAIAVIRAMRKVAPTRENDHMVRQLLRASSSVGANYRSACRARSTADYISKIGIVEEEADESQYWLEVMVEPETLPEAELAPLSTEASELTAIFTASRHTAKKGR